MDSPPKNLPPKNSPIHPWIFTYEKMFTRIRAKKNSSKSCQQKCVLGGFTPLTLRFCGGLHPQTPDDFELKLKPTGS